MCKPYLSKLCILISASIFFMGVVEMAYGGGITSNVLLRVRRIIVGHQVATAFTIEVDGRQYVITAKHVVSSITGSQGVVQLCSDHTTCADAPVTVLRCDDPIDIAVLVPSTQVSVAFPLPASLKSAIIGQDMFFVGFPLNDSALTTRTNANESIGFVRKGTFSAQETTATFTRIYLDGRNNSGFSGGPVVYPDLGRSGTEFRVAAVVSGYRSLYSEVMKVETVDQERITLEDRAQNRILQMSDGTYRKLVPTGNVVADNTGIVVAYAIDHALDLIRRAGVKGPEVK